MSCRAALGTGIMLVTQMRARSRDSPAFLPGSHSTQPPRVCVLGGLAQGVEPGGWQSSGPGVRLMSPSVRVQNPRESRGFLVS